MNTKKTLYFSSKSCRFLQLPPKSYETGYTASFCYIFVVINLCGCIPFLYALKIWTSSENQSMHLISAWLPSEMSFRISCTANTWLYLHNHLNDNFSSKRKANNTRTVFFKLWEFLGKSQNKMKNTKQTHGAQVQE